MLSDDKLFKILKEELFTAVVGDILDTAGLIHQFLPPEIKPLRFDMVLVGRAMPVLEADYFIDKDNDWKNPISKKPFGLMFHALDNLKQNEIYVATGGSGTYAYWGELMSTRAIKLGCTGALINGFSRDTNGVLGLNFPVFTKGTYAQDQGVRGKVVDYGIPVEIAGIKINPGDIIFGDRDGVLVIPKIYEQDVIQKALEKVKTENKVKIAIEQGMGAVEAFDKFGVF